jgi:hypothetical protein
MNIQKYEWGGRLKVKISILFYEDNETLNLDKWNLMQ